ncbi:DUF6787 family protein [Tunicatimonas pelagia]|uniref:DUF6787 family protein n=1 Tax=Tunicatimonas pelagia TaxID=931531 RepID=UPI0026670D33|nr:DUF6787 family protein [Tunicatimonas pelagia]WKN43844.1 hypothetical protein P0M28_02520 [Tunicatimonas pelagia]
MKFLKKLQNRWKVDDIRQVLVILLVFSLTGSSIVMIRPVIFQWVGVTAETSGLTRWLWYIGFIIPAYQVLLLGYGWLFGQYHFFARRYQKMIPSRFMPSHK